MDVEFSIESGIVFNGYFDLIQAQSAVPAVFTLSHEGELGLDVPRTRDFYKEALNRLGEEPQWTCEWQHCVLVDNATSWPQYALVTGKELVGAHPDCALRYFQAIKQPAIVSLSLSASSLSQLLIVNPSGNWLLFRTGQRG